MLRSFFSADSRCSTCGTNINNADLEFKSSKSSLAYVDKVFSYNEGVSCPISYTLNTVTSEITTQLITSKDNLPPIDPCAEPVCECTPPVLPSHNQCCCCCGNGADCAISAASVFTIERSYAIINSITPATAIEADDVTLNGSSVNAVTIENGIYTVDISNLENEISNTRCLCNGLLSKAFFMINGITGWNLTGTLILDGTVNTGGSTCNFRLTVDITSPLAITGTTAFAISDAGVPCSIHGISPAIQFTIGGKLNILNPEITVTDNAAELTALVILEPSINLEVTRKTLMCMTGYEANMPCDNSIELMTVGQGCTEEPCCICNSGQNENIQNSCTQSRGNGNNTEDYSFQFNETNGCSCGF